MKKIVSIILSVFIMLTAFSVGAAIPDFLTKPMTNYSADYDIAVSFDNSEEVVNLLKEMEMPEEFEYFVDVEALLRTLLSFEGKMNVQADISKDYTKTKLAVTGSSDHNIFVNGNLTMDVDTKMGMWINMDMSDTESPVFDVIYQQPFMNKYMKIGSDYVFSDEEAAKMLKTMYTKEYMELLQSTSIDLYMKYATISGKGSRYTIEMDNEAFAEYINETLQTVWEIMAVTMPQDNIISRFKFPEVDEWTFLGEDGFKTEVTLFGGQIRTQKMVMDISLDVAKIYTDLTGGIWDFESDGVIDFTITMDAEVDNIGKTKVKFPELTEDNSFTMSDLENMYGGENVAEPVEYPLWYVGEYCDYLTAIDGEVYVPLRQTIEAAYGDSISIDFDNGNITMTCPYFEGYDAMKIAIDSDTALINGEEYDIMKPVLIEGKTYVSNTLFTELFGWDFTYASYNLVDGEYQYTFYTNVEW